ncbi:MarR family transcriptional regulator [Frankia sp. AgB1.9]|uniref:MarR family winged helix-turn-helix transcriptional regulator n=1 Tax=unclassified Frankia TaxID=2632575 RepID=UPI0019335A2D|nr:MULTISPECIES: MarR family transcriptional regulator [unclassified Frankia]MBL7486983.1 MarR family transcriptional regulator [Frankia sp. AgW1.1]MBL7548846.1 MarR family transcriptional regulator [Frankia sp. AgB1.9]MBL7619684.1 MarR family transcriptional regulator [Frankia sp. AgB1.8]
MVEPASPTGDALTHAVVKQVILLAGTISTLGADLLKELDLTEPLANALWRLDPDAPAPSMRMLAATLNCDPSTVTFLTDRLEQRGLIQRRPVPTNRRQKVISLTDRGVEARGRLIQALTAGSPFARLSTEDRHQLHVLLGRAGADPSRFTCQPSTPTGAGGNEAGATNGPDPGP